MRRRDVEERGRPLRQLVRNQAFEIDGDAGDLRAGRLEGKRRALVARVLDRARRAVIEKEPRRNADALLCAVDDDDAAGIGGNAAGGGEMIGDGRAQRRQAGRIAILRQPAVAAVREIACSSRRQVFSGNSAGFGRPGKKSNDSRLRCWSTTFCTRSGSGGIGMCDSAAARAGSGSLVRGLTAKPGKLSATKIPEAGRDSTKPSTIKRVVGANHGVARHRKLFGEPTRRRQPRAGADARVADGVAKLLDELAGERLAPGAVEQDGNLHAAKHAAVCGGLDWPGPAILGPVWRHFKAAVQLVLSIRTSTGLVGAPRQPFLPNAEAGFA